MKRKKTFSVLRSPFSVLRAAQFDASFEGGNLGSARQITENEYELAIRPDTNAARYRLWFHFRVSNARPGQKVLFHVTNFSKSKSLYKDGMSPVFRAGPSGDRTWERVHPKNVFYYRTKDALVAPNGRGASGRGAASALERCSSGGSAGNDDDGEKGTLSDGNESERERRRPRKPHILSFTHVFGKDDTERTKRFQNGTAEDASSAADDAPVSAGRTEPTTEDAFVEFAYSYPFAFAEQQSTLDALEERNLPHVHRRTLARTLQGRRCDVLVIDGGDDPDAPPGTALAPRRVAFLSCRVHPGETPASHALAGFLDFVVSSAPDAVALRRKVTFVVVPMLNPDGCVAGNYRADSNGVDLNRRWRDCTAAREPTLHATKALIKWYARDPCHALDFFVDVHAHTSSKASFLYVEPPSFGEEEEKECEEQETGDKARQSGETFRRRCEKAFAWERAAALPRMLELNAGPALGFALNHCRFCENPEKSGAGRRAVSAMLASEERLVSARAREAEEEKVSEEEKERFTPVSLGLLRGAGAGMCYTLEMSFYGVCPRGGGPAPRWSPWGSNDEQYRAFGVGLAYSFLDYYGIRRDAESEAVTARVFNAAATGERAAPERAFGNPSAAAERTDLFAACAAPSQGHGRPEERDAVLSEKPWLRGASREERAEKSRSSSRASKSERAAKRAAAAAAAAALAKEKARPERPKSSPRRESRVLASSVRVVGSDMDADLARFPAGDLPALAAGKMVGGVVPPARARRGKRDDGDAASAILRFSFPAAGSREIKSSRTAPASPNRRTPCGGAVTNSKLEGPSGPATELASADASLGALVAPEATSGRAGGAPESRRANPNAFGAGGRFRNTSELRNAARVGSAKRAPPKAAAKKTKGGTTLLGSFRVPGLGAFGKASEGAAGTAGDGGDAFGIEAEFARAELSE
jgi:hypothetical protein